MTDPAPDQDAPDVAPEATGDGPTEIKRRGLFRKRTPVPAEGADAVEVVEVTEVVEGTEPDDDTGGRSTRPGVLRRRRRKLLGQYEQGIFDLGGLALELHRRGLLAEDVMRRKAAEVTDLRGQVDSVDEELEEIRTDRAERRQSGRGASRTCPQCGARCKASAKFCSECGAPLTPVDPGAASAAPPADQPTQVIVDESTQHTQVIAEGASQETAVLPPAKVDE